MHAQRVFSPYGSASLWQKDYNGKDNSNYAAHTGSGLSIRDCVHLFCNASLVECSPSTVAGCGPSIAQDQNMRFPSSFFLISEPAPREHSHFESSGAASRTVRRPHRLITTIE